MFGTMPRNDPDDREALLLGICNISALRHRLFLDKFAAVFTEGSS